MPRSDEKLTGALRGAMSLDVTFACITSRTTVTIGVTHWLSYIIILLPENMNSEKYVCFPNDFFSYLIFLNVYVDQKMRIC